MSKGRLKKAAENLESIRKILTNLIWIGVILIILVGLGWLATQSGLPISTTPEKPQETVTVKPLQPQIDWQKVDASVAVAMRSARDEVRLYAETELDIWIAGLMERVDSSFLDWYFDYWTQQLLGLKGLYQYGVHYFIHTQPTAAEKLTEEIQMEFSKRVLRPQISEKVIERIINESSRKYITVLRDELHDIPYEYEISRAEWQHYLEDIAITIAVSEGGRQAPLTLKTLTVSAAGGSVLLAAKLKSVVAKITPKVVTKSSGKVASAMAAKTSGKVAAKLGGKFLGTITGIGVLVWDIWDHRLTEQQNRPELRQSLAQYFAELKLILLDDPDFGVMTSLYQIEHQLTEKKS